jgi:DNA-binding transcriptional MerR regulator
MRSGRSPAKCEAQSGRAGPARMGSYSSGEAAARAGLARQTLLSWERRYGFPQPLRNARGHRRYTDADVMAIALVRAIVDQGCSIEDAIARVADSTSRETEPSHDYSLLLAALDNMPHPVAVLRSPDFRFVYVNRALSKAVPAARVGTTVEAVLEGRGGVTALEWVVRTGEAWHERAEPVEVAGKTRYFAATYLRLPAREHQPHHVLSIGYDVTDAVHAQAQLGASHEALEESVAIAYQNREYLRTVTMLTRASHQDWDRLLRLAMRHTCHVTGASSCAVMVHRDGWFLPAATYAASRGTRWNRVSAQASPALEQAFERQETGWVTASRIRSRQDHALLRRLAATKLCCVPLDGPEGHQLMLLIRWTTQVNLRFSREEHDFIDTVRSVLNLAALIPEGKQPRAARASL